MTAKKRAKAALRKKYTPEANPRSRAKTTATKNRFRIHTTPAGAELHFNRAAFSRSSEILSNDLLGTPVKEEVASHGEQWWGTMVAACAGCNRVMGNRGNTHTSITCLCVCG